MIGDYLPSQYNHQMRGIFKDHNFNLAEAGLNPGLPGDSLPLYHLYIYDLITFPQFIYSTADSLKKKNTWLSSSTELTKSGSETKMTNVQDLDFEIDCGTW